MSILLCSPCLWADGGSFFDSNIGIYKELQNLDETLKDSELIDDGHKVIVRLKSSKKRREAWQNEKGKFNKENNLMTNELFNVVPLIYRQFFL